MATRMQQRRGTLADWTAVNPVLMDGEIGFETDTHMIRVGDGVTPFLSLPHYAGPQGPQGGVGPQGSAGPQGSIGLTWRGAWGAANAYVVNDVVTSSGGTYRRKVAGTTPTAPQVDPTNWDPVASPGAQGPQGAAGSAGPQGVVGPQGAAGPQGSVGMLRVLSLISGAEAGADANIAQQTNASTSTLQALPTPFANITFTVDVTRRYRMRVIFGWGQATANMGITVFLLDGGASAPVPTSPGVPGFEIGDYIPTTANFKVTSYEFEIRPGSMSAGVHHLGFFFRARAGGTANILGGPSFKFFIDDVT